ncbi:hypothetical protein [Methylobacter tundripaludum]|uniref:hypothetical protein n=1 Tax=Methylobacter tundripaludum TaxID=173365 RepID=UPI0012377E52|nr:hypothetical protein [Methylobacter tundripaludum]
MMRMVMEIVMVIAIVLGMVFMMKVTAEENNFNKTLPDNDNDNGDEHEDGDSNDGVVVGKSMGSADSIDLKK